jgi:1,4-dihydroxy-2-naphthoate octaprenyltransferase
MRQPEIKRLDEKNMNDRSGLSVKFLNRSQLFLFLCTALMYALGAGIAHYQGKTIDWPVLFSGAFWLFLIQLSAGYLNDYYRLDAPDPSTPPDPSQKEIDQRRREKFTLLAISATGLTVAALVTFSLLRSGVLDIQISFVMAVVVFGVFLLVIPPVRLIQTGFGELTLAILVCNIVPLVSYLLQTGDYNRLVAMSSFPLTALFLAMILAMQFEHYGTDCIYCRSNMLVKLGWQWGGRLHSTLIILAYLLIGFAYIQGLPWRIVWPLLLTIVLAVLQVFLMNRIISGEKPVWILLNISAAALFLLTAYLITYSFWMV